MHPTLNLLVVSAEPRFVQLVESSLAGSPWRSIIRPLDSVDGLADALAGRIDVIICESPAAVPVIRILTLISSQRPDCPLIVVAQNPDLESAVEVLKYGAADYLPLEKIHRLPQAIDTALQGLSRVAYTSAALQAAESLKILLETVIEGIVIADQEGNITLVNASCARMFGYEVTDLIGQPISLLMPEPHHSAHDQYVRRYMGTGLSRVIGLGRELTGLRKEGSIFPIEIAMSAAQMGNRYFFVATMRDLTEQKLIEEARRNAERLRTELDHEKQLRELKNRFISMITHELRNPLAAMQISLDTLQTYDDRIPAAMRAEKLNSIQQQISRMGALVEDALIVGQQEAGKLSFRPQVIDIVAFSLDIFRELEQSLGINHRMVFSGPSGPILCACDTRLLQQAIINLASNAVKYSPSGTPITMAVRVNEIYAEISVADQGIGIPANEQAKLLAEFHRATNVGKIQGTGLGLVITKQVIEMHQGALHFQSTEGHGSVFTLSLPLYTAD